MPIQLIVGLQNPGPEYDLTRHNAGAWLLHSFAKQYNASFRLDKKLLGAIANIPNLSCKLFLPTNFMNLNGQSVRAVCDFYNISPSEILVVHDDLDLLPGRVKLKTGGGHGGHNGLRDLIKHLNSAMFHRLRIGIGHPGHRDQVADYVLSRPRSEERQLILSSIDQVITNFPLILSGDFDKAMSILH